MRTLIGNIAAALLTLTVSSGVAAADKPSDAQIAHIAYTAGELDIKAAQQALDKRWSRSSASRRRITLPARASPRRQPTSSRS